MDLTAPNWTGNVCELCEVENGKDILESVLMFVKLLKPTRYAYT